MGLDTSQVLTLTFLFALILKVVLERDCETVGGGQKHQEARILVIVYHKQDSWIQCWKCGQIGPLCGCSFLMVNKEVGNSLYSPSGSDTLSTVNHTTFKYCPITGVGPLHKAYWENAHNTN